MNNRSLLLHLLREVGDRGLTTAEILQAGVGSRYGARLLELREHGYAIQATRLRPGSWRYVLVGEPPAVSEGAPTPASAPSEIPALFETSAHQPAFDELCPKPRSAIHGWDD